LLVKALAKVQSATDLSGAIQMLVAEFQELTAQDEAIKMFDYIKLELIKSYNSLVISRPDSMAGIIS